METINNIRTTFLNWKKGKIPGFSGKDLINIEQVTVKLVKVEPNAKYPIHIHPDKTEFAFVVEGKPEFIINQINYVSEVHDFFIFPQNLPHTIINNTNQPCLLLIGGIKQ